MAIRFAVALILTAMLAPLSAHAETSAERGLKLLLDTPYLPPDFHQTDFDETWQTWEEPLRTQAESATLEERRRMAFARYGLTPRADDPSKPRQYVVQRDGYWVMSCLACHEGKTAGKSLPGVPNSLFALQTLTEEIRRTKVRMEHRLTRMDVGSMFMPLGGSNGTTNAVMFGVVLMAHRDADLNVHPDRPIPRMTHHDHDAPAWWHFHRKSHLYIDGFAPKSHRALMQFTLVKENGPTVFHRREDDFRDIYAYLDSLRAPKYPFAVDDKLAESGKAVFNQRCSTCHGTYGAEGSYPGKTVAIERIGTDRVRFDSLLPEQRSAYGASWFTQFGQDKVIASPIGYVAPPLDGIWATAPYFHNGSVPTLWHLLHPSERPRIWLRNEDGYDQEKVGLEVSTFDKIPKTANMAPVRRRYFDTRLPSKSNPGHPFQDALSEDDKRAVLEYLKTL